MLGAIPAAGLGLCIDTGHSAYAGVDPVALYEDYRDRCDYLHFKYVDADVHAHVVTERIDFLAAVTGGSSPRSAAASSTSRACGRRSSATVSTARPPSSRMSTRRWGPIRSATRSAAWSTCAGWGLATQEVHA